MTDISIESKYLKHIEIGPLNCKWSAKGDRILRYFIDFQHKELNLYRELGAPELYLLQGKVDALMATWDKKFDAYKIKSAQQAGQAEADQMTIDAGIKLSQIDQILAHTLKVDDTVDWESLKDRSSYSMPAKFPDMKPALPKLEKPQPTIAKTGFFDLLFGQKQAKLKSASDKTASDLERWEASKTKLAKDHRIATDLWVKNEKEFWETHKLKQKNFDNERDQRNQIVDDLMASLETGSTEAVLEHVSLVLDKSDYFDLFEKSYYLSFDTEEGLLGVEYDIPSPDDLPSTKSVKFVKASGELKETKISDRQKKLNFESAAYQIGLRTIHEIFESDEFENIKKVLFNGFVTSINRATGKSERACLLSVLTSKEQFEAIDLEHVEPKACFKALNGVSAARLTALSAIAPIMTINRDDRRFVDSKDIGDSIEGENIAAMPWEDFEHLIRELFEKEFQSRGGEVKVTQTSSDGGIDAVAFDPDPISGGKIVIQAKRYTRTVGVSAVRDLFGAVMNEGASKGILVTTADFGPESHKFAADKPITLLNGGNLLHMLHRHNYSATINLEEARKAMSEAK